MNDSRSANQYETGAGGANAARDRRSSPFQFSILELLGLMTAVGVAAGLLFAAPAPLVGPAIVIVNIAIPSVLATIAIYGQGYQRTFCIGALFPASVMIIGLGLLFAAVQMGSVVPRDVVQDSLESRFVNAFMWGMIPTCGWLAMIVRFLVEGRQKP